jgi:DNA polymerase III subunit alpha
LTPQGVRFGLTAIKNVGEGAIDALLAVRKNQGRIASLHALCEELDLRLVNKRVFESLVKAGAFDSISGDTDLPTASMRPRLMAAIDAACEHGARLQRDRLEGQAQLFGALGMDGDEEAGTASTGGGRFRLSEAKPWTEAEQLAYEKETLGLYWTGHPVDRYAAALKDFGARSIAELAEGSPTAPRDNGWGPGGPKPIEVDTSVGGIVGAVRPLKTRKGDRMAVFTLEDAGGGVEVIAFPEAFQRSAGLIESGTLVLVRGRLERDEESVRLLASEVAPLETVRERLAQEIAIHFRKPADRGTLETLGEIFARHRGDRKVSFEVETGEPPNRLRVRVDVSAQIRVRPSSALIAEVESVVGSGSVELR